jgi:hypothetical protein
MLTRVVTVAVVGGVVVDVVVLDTSGSHMLNRQNVGSTKASDSAPVSQIFMLHC